MSSDKDASIPAHPDLDSAVVPAELGIEDKKHANDSQSPNAEREGNTLTTTNEARTLARDAYAKKLYDEDIEIRKWKRRIGVPAVFIAGSVSLLVLGVAYFALLGGLKEQLSDPIIKIVLISTSILSFIVIYGTIIRSTLTSSQQSADDSNLQARIMSEVARKNLGNE